ncbi:polysaccharide deacetylase family protein [Actinomycetaceae bacterium WB03_NA08]|uniref:Polysaccharide deacetylase family protein n=1 Tax=Scrofimicrobium canadense TaxID=2652290 RepID=A0A6N7VVF1_9ACTO|nr:polysaccharide deacetylase family protein [Scrofimicrobium canadense]MSS84960.1 polysaccharide deacetylase family protein [Scrofimicrobium canadense]
MASSFPNLGRAPSLPSRIVTVDLAETHIGQPETGAKVDFTLPQDIHVRADGVIVQAGTVTLELDANGRGEIRLPCYSSASKPEDWVILVKKHWAPYPYPIRVPAGNTKISLASLEPPVEVSDAMAKFVPTDAVVRSIKEGSQWAASAEVDGGIINLDFTVPPGGTAWPRGGLNTSADLDGLFGQASAGIYRIQTQQIASALGLPSPAPGVLTVQWTRSVSGDDSMHIWEPATGGRFTRRYTGTWSTWVNDSWIKGAITSGDDLDAYSTFAAQGVYRVGTAAEAAAIAHIPTNAPGTLTVTWSGADRAYHEYSCLHGIFIRQLNAGAGWSDWTRLATLADIPDSPTASGPDAGLANSLLQEDFSRRMGGRILTGGKGAVAFRFDHGLAAFQTKVLPLLQARGIVGSQAINSRNWDYPENEGVTPEIVNVWVRDGLVEIWNHSATHTNPTSLAELEREIITGLAELRTQLPDAQIDGWAVPGVNATDPYMGFGTGTSVQDFYQTDAGRMILTHHAVATGHIPGTHRRVLDGRIRQGQHQYTIDSRSITEIKTEIDQAITEKTGLQIMLHPSQLDLEGKLTTPELEEMLDYAVVKQTNGELVILSPYQLMIASSS